jgi:hypothetical protein
VITPSEVDKDSSERHRTAEKAEAVVEVVVEEEEELGRGAVAAPLPMRRLTPDGRDSPPRSSIQKAADRSHDGDAGVVGPIDPCFRSMALRKMPVGRHGLGSWVSGVSYVVVEEEEEEEWG